MQQTPTIDTTITAAILQRLGVQSTGNVEDDLARIDAEIKILKEKNPKRYLALLKEVSEDIKMTNAMLDQFRSEIEKEKILN